MNKDRIKKEIDDEIEKMEELEKTLMMLNKHAPKGNLRCAKKGNSFQYYNGKEYLGKNRRKLIESMANHDYYEELLRLVCEKKDKLERMLDLLKFDFCRPEKLYSELHQARQCLVKPLLISREEYLRQWAAEEYDHWKITDDETNTTFLTVKGERVRSKSEKIIADSLHRYGIPYRYEYPLQLRDGNRIITVRPDFVALNVETLEELIIEHLGMMGEEQYYQKNMNKIDLYERNGYLIGRKLILLHETAESPLNTTIMERYIEENLLF